MQNAAYPMDITNVSIAKELDEPLKLSSLCESRVLFFFWTRGSQRRVKPGKERRLWESVWRVGPRKIINSLD